VGEQVLDPAYQMAVEGAEIRKAVVTSAIDRHYADLDTLLESTESEIQRQAYRDAGARVYEGKLAPQLDAAERAVDRAMRELDAAKRQLAAATTPEARRLAELAMPPLSNALAGGPLYVGDELRVVPVSGNFAPETFAYYGAIRLVAIGCPFNEWTFDAVARKLLRRFGILLPPGEFSEQALSRATPMDITGYTVELPDVAFIDREALAAKMARTTKRPDSRVIGQLRAMGYETDTVTDEIPASQQIVPSR
jgi:hypothetical protein